MNKIKNMFSGMIVSVKETLKKFPITTIIIFACTLIVTFLVIDTNFSADVDELIEHILAIGGFASVGTWLVEAIYEDKKDIKRIVGYVISFIIAIIFDRIIKYKWLEEALLARIIVEYIIGMILLSVYVLMKKSKEKFERYALNLLLNIKRVSIIFGIISIGFLILYAIFKVLILSSLEFSIVLKILCLFAGFYYLPVVLKAFANEEAEDTKFNRVVFSNVLLPLVVLAMAIIYIYIAKIFLITEVPKNELFSILSMIFVCAYPVYVVNKNYAKEGTVLYKINKMLPYLYIPFIFLQIYSMGIRINEYGLTTSRYMACVLVIFEIIAISLAIVKNSKYLREIVLVTVIISAMISITPFNYDTLPKLSQKAIVDKYIEKGTDFDSLSDTDKGKFAGAYQYIEHDERYVNKELTQVEKEKLSSYNTYRYSYSAEKESKTKSVYLNKKLNSLDISAYSKISEIPYSYNTEGTVIESHNMVEFSVDLGAYIQKIIDANEISEATAERVFDELQVVPVDENKDIFLTEFSITYEKDTREINYIRIEGYLLQK